MPESGVRFVFGCIFHRDQSDGPFPDENEGKAKAYGLHQRVSFFHSCHSTDAAHRCQPSNFDLAV